MPRRGLGRGRGRGSQHNQFAAISSLNDSPKRSSTSLDRLSHYSFQHDTSVDSTEFFTPRSEIRKHARLEKRRQKVITGRNSAHALFGSFKGVPEPSRDIFVFRVAKSVEQADILKYLKSQSIDIRGFSCVSHEEATYKSFRLTTGVSDYKRVFEDTLWPSGVHVRRFIPPESKTNAE